MSEYYPEFREASVFSRLYQESLVDTGALMLEMIDKAAAKRLLVKFEQYYAYRKCDESYALKTLAELNHAQNQYHWCYRVEASSFLSWFYEESYEIYKDAKHFLIVTSDELIDVIAQSRPEIEIAGL